MAANARKPTTMTLTEIREQVYKVYPRAYYMPITVMETIGGKKGYTEYQIKPRVVGGDDRKSVGAGRTRRIVWTEAMETIQKQ